MNRAAMFCVTVLLAVIAGAQPLAAQADEIQVYDGGLAPRGVAGRT